MMAYGSPRDRQQAYLGLLESARRLNDRQLVHLILRKINTLSPVAPIGSDGGMVVAFPAPKAAGAKVAPRPSMCWVLLKLTLLIPGSVTALFLLALFRT